MQIDMLATSAGIAPIGAPEETPMITFHNGTEISYPGTTVRCADAR
ncbi:hypothetical protein [Spirosoma radiotolerans]|nr:hypothetical protein [Spirosoma radiotolerans]